MNKQNIITTPSIADAQVLYSRWKLIAANADKSLAEFYDFLTGDTVDKRVFLSQHTVESFSDIKHNIVVVKVTPK